MGKHIAFGLRLLVHILFKDAYLCNRVIALVHAKCIILQDLSILPSKKVTFFSLDSYIKFRLVSGIRLLFSCNSRIDTQRNSPGISRENYCVLFCVG
jgi:hypothetical protein